MLVSVSQSVLLPVFFPGGEEEGPVVLKDFLALSDGLDALDSDCVLGEEPGQIMHIEQSYNWNLIWLGNYTTIVILSYQNV